jgi:hypothetical protein
VDIHMLKLRKKIASLADGRILILIPFAARDTGWSLNIEPSAPLYDRFRRACLTAAGLRGLADLWRA